MRNRDCKLETSTSASPAESAIGTDRHFTEATGKTIIETIRLTKVRKNREICFLLCKHAREIRTRYTKIMRVQGKFNSILHVNYILLFT